MKTNQNQESLKQINVQTNNLGWEESKQIIQGGRKVNKKNVIPCEVEGM